MDFSLVWGLVEQCDITHRAVIGAQPCGAGPFDIEVFVTEHMPHALANDAIGIHRACRHAPTRQTIGHGETHAGHALRIGA